MPFDNWILLVVLVVVTLLWVAVIVVGWRILWRARARSRELNEQIVDILRSIDHLRRHQHRFEQLTEVERATAAVHLAAERGSVSHETSLKLLTHLHDVREALLDATVKPVDQCEA